MIADIVPILAALSGVDQTQVDAAFAAAWDAAKAGNRGYADSRAFTEAALAVCGELGLELTALNAGWKAKEAADARYAGSP
jgi:hypothetical protein